VAERITLRVIAAQNMEQATARAGGEVRDQAATPPRP
jgi:hypothetical protein